MKKVVEDGLRAAIKLSPGFTPAYDQLASRLLFWNRPADAAAVVDDWLKNARTPRDAAMARRKKAELEQIQTARAQAAVQEKARMEEDAHASTLVPEEVKPKHPTEPPTGAKHEILGVIRGVQCSYPAVIEFRVEGAKKTVALYNNDYSKLEFSAFGYTPEGNLNPCADLEGRKARIGYVESSDKTVDGQAIAVELRK